MRRGASAPGYARAVRQNIRPVRLSARGVPPRVRTCGSDADRFRPFGKRRAFRARRAGGRAATKSRQAGGRGRSRQPRSGGLRRNRAGPQSLDCRSRNSRAMRSRPRGRNLGFRPERGARLLAQACGDDRNIRRASGHRRRPLPSHRRPRISRSRTTLRHRTIERSHHHSRLQSLSPGFGTHRRAKPPRAAPRVRRRVFD